MKKTCPAAASSFLLIAVIFVGVKCRASWALGVCPSRIGLAPSLETTTAPTHHRASIRSHNNAAIRCRRSTTSSPSHWSSSRLYEKSVHNAALEEEVLSVATTATAATTTLGCCWTREQLEAYALQQGVVLSLTTLGPGFRAVARSRHDPTLVLGYVEGWMRPSARQMMMLPLLHLDQMQVFRPAVKQARRENPQQFRGGGTVLGVGLLMGYLCLLHGQQQSQQQQSQQSQGCQVAEFLAIDDQEFQHKRLVRYYKHAGFDVVKYVGDDFKSIPDRLVWGGCGTLLRQEIPVLLKSWTRLMEKSLEKDSR